MQKTTQVYPIPALKDNYIWMIVNSGEAYAVDPGESAPVIAFLDANNVTLKAILITHHHADHVQGIAGLLTYRDAPVVGSQHSLLSELTHRVHEGSEVKVSERLPTLQILDILGHTLDHIAFYTDGMLFCGDTLFAGGCGRIFEGTGKMLYASLQKIAQLPLETLIYCAHEYTLLNLKFAHHVEPNNIVVNERLKKTLEMHEQHLPSLPSSLLQEMQTNPFLRCYDPELQRAVEGFYGKKIVTTEEVFIALRQWKDNF